MQFTTPVTVLKSDFPVSYESEILSLGSCFAENISDKFHYFGFRHAVNPFGILFHPVAIEKILRFSADQKSFSASDVFLHNERWHCFDAHSDLSHPDRDTLLSNLNTAVALTSEKIRTSTHIVITLGTAWVYRHSRSGDLVAGCHKVAQGEFLKELLSVGRICESVKNISRIISDVNPDAQIIFTVSPVRHIKDGMVENQRSKSHLLSGLHSAIENAPNGHYFPSYEIMTDELRDYRFYAPDMIHPSPVAIDYIWQKFCDAWIPESEFSTMDEVGAIRKALSHRAFNPDSAQHQKFLSSVQNRVASLRERLPYLVFD